MNPTGCYERFQDDILRRYNNYDEDDFVTFGILIADPRQSAAREFIFNYFDVLNDESGEYFDFFIPGYTEFAYPDDARKVYISINKKDYYFSYELFDDFWRNFERNFNIEYTFNPMLILMTMRPGHRDTVEYVIIELDDIDDHGLRRCNMFFRKIFEKAKTTSKLNDFQTMFQRTYVRGNLLNSIVNAIGQDWLTEINHVHSEIKRYRIRRS